MGQWGTPVRVHIPGERVGAICQALGSSCSGRPARPGPPALTHVEQRGTMEQRVVVFQKYMGFYNMRKVWIRYEAGISQGMDQLV